MSDADFDLGAPELAPEDLLRIEDPYFSPETVAIVTGAASGIGRTTAVALAANGLTVVGADIDEDGLAGTATFVDEFDVDGEFVQSPTDLTDDGDVEAVVAAAAEAGTLRFVANVAGMNTSRASPSSPWQSTTC